MDWRNRRYFKIILDPWHKEEELNAIKLLKGIKISPYKYLEKMPDETEKRGYYTYLISVPKNRGDIIEAFFKVVIKPSAFSLVEEIERDVSKKFKIKPN